MQRAADEQHAPAVLDEGKTERCRKMRLASAGRAKQHDIGTLIEPAVAGGKRHDLRLADHGHGFEVEGVEGFARRQLGAGEMPLDAAATTVGHLVFGECREKAGGWPTLLVRTYGQIGPHQLHGRQAQLGEQ
jgi:hypothetical protein